MEEMGYIKVNPLIFSEISCNLLLSFIESKVFPIIYSTKIKYGAINIANHSS